MISYTTLWQKGDEYFNSWIGKSGMPFTDEDRMIYIAGFVQGYLHLNQTEVAYEQI